MAPSTDYLAIARPILLLVGGVSASLLLRSLITRRRRNPSGLPLPPGPKGLPIIGNALQVPKPEDYPWKGYDELCKRYGDIVYLNALGQGLLILGNSRRALDLLEKRAVVYSDRPIMPVMELIDLEWTFGAMPYGPKWRDNRRAFHQHLNHNAVVKYHPILYEERDIFLRALKEHPEDIFKHVRLFFGTSIMRTAYGFDDIKQNETLIHDAELVLDGFTDAITPGKFLVNLFPILKYVPSWIPGAGFQTYCKRVAEITRRTKNAPFVGVKVNLAQGKRGTHPSMAASFIDNLPEESELSSAMEDIARSVCATAYVAGADTTVSSATALLLALAVHPKVQEKAQAELDAVVGKDRLPRLTDQPLLPYIQAIVKETGRWYTVIPLGLPHATSEDDEYNGYFIPKGTFVVANSWAIMHDAETFDQPFEFRPERYLKDGKIDPTVPDPEMAAFGFGRRICPGRHMSNDVMFLFAASLLATFNLSPAKDEGGNEIELKLEVVSQPIPTVLPFKCTFTVRSDSSAQGHP